MRAGAAQVDITPAVGAELSGFAARTQPSTGVHDPLHAKALWLEDGSARLLWIHCDLIGFDRRMVDRFRQWARSQPGLRDAPVMLSATHTHSGPCTIHLEGCGRYDEGYAEFLQSRLEAAATASRAGVEECDIVLAEGRLDLAIDRRRKSSAHTDPRVAGLGFRRRDGRFLAVVVNYAIHPVALGHQNREASADLFAAAAEALTSGLEGQPIALVTNGACGNLNPPAVNVSFAQVASWGGRIATAIVDPLAAAAATPGRLRLRTRTVRVPMETLAPDAVAALVGKSRSEVRNVEWGEKFRRVLENWERNRTSALRQGTESGHRDIEVFVAEIGDAAFVGINAEVFSVFGDWLRQETGRKVYVIGYANGDLGYLATEAAYAEGGYEVDSAHFFYDDFRFRAGALETVARAAVKLLTS